MFCNCNCTLVGTEVCEHCDGKSYFISPFITTLIVWDDVLKTGHLPTYNPETHELVEKKEAKIERLEEELQVELTKVGECSSVLKEFTKQLEEARNNVENLTKELDELKKE